MERLKELLKQSPNDTFVQFAMAKEMEKSGDINGAIKGFENLLSLTPEYIGAYYHLAALYVENERFSNAMEVYDKGIEMATLKRDAHALAELKNAKLNLELESGI